MYLLAINTQDGANIARAADVYVSTPITNHSQHILFIYLFLELHFF